MAEAGLIFCGSWGEVVGRSHEVMEILVFCGLDDIRFSDQIRRQTKRYISSISSVHREICPEFARFQPTDSSLGPLRQEYVIMFFASVSTLGSRNIAGVSAS
jgi:hypothetical protein